MAGTSATVAGSNILPQPQYAGDRFRDDYNPPALKVGVNTYSLGTVFNVTKWLGIYGNDATTFNPNILVQRLNGARSFQADVGARRRVRVADESLGRSGQPEPGRI